jgi:hypothetical protein
MSEESSNLKAFICHHEYKMARALGLSYAYKQKKETIQMVSTTVATVQRPYSQT